MNILRHAVLMKLASCTFLLCFGGMNTSQAADGVAVLKAPEIKIAARDPGPPELDDAAKRDGLVQAGGDRLSNPDAGLQVYLALHCQALAGLPLRESLGAYASSTCKDTAGRANTR